MTTAAVLFLIVAGVTAGGAIGVVVSRGVIHSAVYLLFSLVGVSLCYFLLGAEYLGATQLVVYVGGTLVLVVFGGMLTAGGPFMHFKTSTKEIVLGSLVAGGLFVLLASVSLQLGSKAPSQPNELPGLGPLGLSFLGIPQPGDRRGTTYLLPFEIVSVHLLVVLIGAAYLARAKRSRSPSTRTSVEVRA